MAVNHVKQLSSHLACHTLTGITLECLPRDGTLGVVRKFAKGTEIWRPNDRADRIYFVESGLIAVITGGTRGREMILNTIDAGEPFGELCFCAQEKGLHHTVARAVVASVVLQVKQREFFDYLQSTQRALPAFVFTFCERLSAAERRIEVLTHRDAEGRLGSLLPQLATTPGEKAGRVELRVRHEDLAQLAAMSRSHVTVTMGMFRRRKLLLYRRGSPTLIDVAALKAYLTGRQAD